MSWKKEEIRGDTWVRGERQHIKYCALGYDIPKGLSIERLIAYTCGCVYFGTFSDEAS